MLFTELNTDVLLHVYGYLDLIDLINLADTCTRLRDVAQLHYQRFKIFHLADCLHDIAMTTERHNRIDATTVLKHIGPFISALEANLDANVIGSDVSTSIRKYCVNVKSLEIIEGVQEQSYNPYSAYSEWLRKLNLTKIKLSIRDLFLIDLSETTTLEELDIYRCRYYDRCWVAFGFISDIFERNCNIHSLSIPLYYGFPHDVFEKLKCLKSLRLDIRYGKSEGHIDKLPANLKMMALEDVDIFFQTHCRRVDDINEFLQKLSEDALHLKCLSVQHPYVNVDANTLSILQLLNLTSLCLYATHPHLYKEIPRIQPNLKHLALMINDSLEFDEEGYVYTTLTDPMEKIIFLIKNLSKLEDLYINFKRRADLRTTLKDFLQESVLCRLFDCYSDNRLLYLACGCYHLKHYIEVELDFGARKWMCSCCGVEQFSGTPNDVNSVRDEAIKWLDSLYT